MPKIDPWGAPANTGFQFEVRPFKRTLWIRLVRQFSIKFTNLSEISIDLS